MLRKLILAATLLVTPLTAMATDYSVKEFRYTNRGAYVGRFHVVYIPTDYAFHCRLYAKDTKFEVTSGDARTFKLSDKNQWHVDKTVTDELEHWQEQICSRTIPEGSEVWGYIEIIAGEAKNCRSSNNHFFYHPDGGRVRYLTKGTTFNNNRCKLKNKGGKKLN